MRKRPIDSPSINVAISREIYDRLAQFARKQSLLKGRRVTRRQTHELALKVFLKLTPAEINSILKRPEQPVST